MRSKPRLIFSDDEQAPPEQPIKTQKATPKPKNENPNSQQRTAQADNDKKAVRLHFKETEKNSFAA